uniref:Uncharacterized protein n=1 Tax=Aegilops tauschii TaxID=37682 RepID=M8BS94_AEGTA
MELLGKRSRWLHDERTAPLRPPPPPPPAAPEAPPTTAESHFGAAAALQLWEGFRHSDMKEKGKN